MIQFIDPKALVGGLTTTSKMPCPSYSLPASACVTGAKLATIDGSICNKCYAKRGHYPMPNVQASMHRRIDALKDPNWVQAMVQLISPYRYFRWHDSGDVQGAWHINKIVDVVRATPDTHHWLPTRERRMWSDWLKTNELPSNLVLRMSATHFDKPIKPIPGTTTTSGSHKRAAPIGFECPAPRQGGACGACRACWDASVPHVSYKSH